MAAVENEMKLSEDLSRTNIKKKKGPWPSNYYLPRFGCFKLDLESPTTVDTNNDDDDDDPPPPPPTHLLIMINGIIGKVDNWRYAAKQFLKTYPRDVIVHRSERNTATLTFDGVDVMGERLADEVISIIKRYPSLCKISFIGHSLGGLVARYAIALLYGRNYHSRVSKVNGESATGGYMESSVDEKYIGKIAGLEPMNFITVATPHLGSRAHKQVPLFCGFHKLELVARQTSWFLGRTGRHLFLTDKDSENKQPLLLRMVNDCEGLPFVSALQSFKRRVAYSNVRFDPLVGWCTSSLRRKNELPERRLLSRNNRYRHIVHVEEAVVHPQEVCNNIESTRDCSQKLSTQEMMETMISALTKLSWERVDVKFKGGKHRLLAHGSIQVETYCIHSAGADVIQHMVDNFLM